MKKTGQTKVNILSREADGFSACITTHPAQPKETICRTCGAPKNAHDGDCPEENEPLFKHDPLLAAEVATLGVSASPEGPLGGQVSPNICRVCNWPKAMHSADCTESDVPLAADDIPFDLAAHAHGPATCHHCRDQANLRMLEAFKAIEQLTRGTLSTHVHQIASDAIKALEAP
jgi:hypothetical protein